MTARAVVALGIGLSAAACDRGIDAGEARVCRQIVAALHIDADRIAINRIVAAPERTPRHGRARESSLVVAYRVEDRSGYARSHGIVCRFAANHDPASIAANLRAVETEHGPLSSARIYMLRRYWLELPDAATADPEPVSGASLAPQVALPVAIAIQNGLAALPRIAIHAVLAAACALVYGLVGRVNLALGDLAALGGYGALLGLIAAGGTQPWTWRLWLAGAFALWGAGVAAAWLGRHVFVPLQRDRGQAPLVASAALAVVIAEATRLLQGDNAHAVPSLLSRPLAVVRAGDYVATTTPLSLVVAAAGAAVTLGVVVILARSRYGRRWRAAGDDPDAAALLGIDVARLSASTYALAGALAGFAGALSAIQYGGVAHGTGLVLGLEAVMAAILGGLGSLSGAVAAAVLIGLFEAAWSALVSIEHRDAAVFVALSVLLVLRPGGFFGRPGLEPRR